MATDGTSEPSRRVRRILWLRQHRILLSLVGLVIGAAFPLILFSALASILAGMERLGLSSNIPFFSYLSLMFLPLCGLAVLPSAIIGLVVGNFLASQRIPYGYCQFCGYDLQNYTVPQCPECGKATASEY